MDPSVLQMPVYTKLAALYDNYLSDPSKEEDHSEAEHAEEVELLEVS